MFEKSKERYGVLLIDEADAFMGRCTSSDPVTNRLVAALIPIK